MAAAPQDPYRTLGVSPGAADAEVRSAYRRLVQQHHPDHNGGSSESALRFEEIQAAYGRIRELRSTGANGPAATPPRPGTDPNLDERMAAMEFELREAQRAREQQLREARLARERAAQAARAAAASAAAGADARAAGRVPGRASDEELGYFSTDDSFTQILSDARSELTERFSRAREHPVVQRVSDLIEGLDSLASQVDRHRARDSHRDP